MFAGDHSVGCGRRPEITFGLYLGLEPRRVKQSISLPLQRCPMRSLPVFIAIAAVLLCPYNCAVRAAADRASAFVETGKACCERCRGEQAPSQDKSPNRESRDEDQSCFCGGAVFDASARAPVDTLLFSAHGALWVDSAISLESPAPEPIANAAAGAPIPGGRLLRIAINSFLI